ncbi:RNA recognition motif domain-containing protein [Ditylenchus destructor]|uniref:RNA recognition motif domain-containing protein n=1 Tax=Ditylenchus destructor TaxID=166010 RepID=A0AAD4QXJ4_9BILA|nr:RNA recognition motif domain-containing protein [Ditylenchus destructor]
MDRALESSPHRIQQEHVTAEIGTHHRQFNLRVLDLSPETTEESLRAFYSRFLKLDRALDAQPHVIDGSEVFLNYSTDELDLMVKEMPEGITEESLHSFFSQYGRVRRCERVTGKSGKAHAFLTFSTVNEVNRAMSDRPHILDKNLLKTDYPGKPGLFPIFVGSLPENVSRMSLFNAFSQFGNIVHLEIRNNGNQSRPYGFVSYGTRQEASKALNAGPHEVDGVSVDVKKAKERNKEK